MRTAFRVFIFVALFFQLDNLFILFPDKESDLLPEYNKIMTIVQSHCAPDQYHLPSTVGLEFKKLKEEIAYCQIRLNGFKLVFDKRYWDEYATPIDRTQIMMHELTHCLFYQEHTSDPKHFMAPLFIVIPENELYVQFNQYLREQCGK